MTFNNNNNIIMILRDLTIQYAIDNFLDVYTTVEDTDKHVVSEILDKLVVELKNENGNKYLYEFYNLYDDINFIKNMELFSGKKWQ